MSENDSEFSNESLPFPDFFNFANNIPETTMLYSSATFTRNELNSSIELLIDLGTDISPNTIWLSPDIFVPDNTFNIIRSIPEITYPNNKNVMILKDLQFLHDIFIHYRITKYDGTNFINQREIRCIPVRADNTPYNSSLFSYQQPDSGQHDHLIIRGHINHNLGDIIKLKINIVQDNKRDDKSDTKLVIFRISWNIMGLNTII